MLMSPRKSAHRKVMRGKNRGIATRGCTVAFGDYGLQSQDNKDVTGRQLEAARQAIARYVQRGAKIWIRVFPHIPYSKKPLDVKMGGGKGNPEFHVAKVKPGTVLFEIKGVEEPIAREALRLASHKLPVRTKIIGKEQI